MRKLWSGAAAAVPLTALVALFYHDLIFRGLILGDYDAFAYFYPLRQYAADALRQGRFPLWNPDLFLGAPFFANVQTAVLYPLNVLFLLMPAPYAYSASMVLHVLLAGVAMYLFARRSLGVSLAPGLMAAITFMFSGFLSGQTGHINQLTVAAWMPLLLVAFDEAVHRRSLALGIATGLVGTLQLLAGHTQEWYFSTVTLGLFALWRMLFPSLRPAIESISSPRSRVDRVAENDPPLPLAQKNRFGWRTSAKGAVSGVDRKQLITRLWPLLLLMVAGLVEVGTTAVQVLPTLELSGESIRAGGMSYWDVVSFSLPPTSALYSILPAYPEQLFSEYVGYVGVVPVVLAVLAVIAWSVRPTSAFMAGLVGFGVFMALGKYNPFYPHLYHWIPGIDLFRVPARWLLVYTFGISGLAGLGAQLVLDLGMRRRRAAAPGPGQRFPLLLKVLVAGLLLSTALILLGLFFRLASPQPTRDQLLVWGGLAGSTLILVGLGALGRRVGWVSLGVLTAMTVGELWAAGQTTSVRHPIPFEAYRPQRTSTTALLQDMSRRDTPGRLLTFATDQYEVKETPDYKKEYANKINPEALIQFMVDIKLSEVLAANIPTEYGIQTVDGYDGGILPLKRYADLKSLLLPGLDLPPDNQLRINLKYVPPMNLVDLLNVRYLLGAKIEDTQIDGVYYDRAISMILDHGQTERLQRLPRISTTSIGLISSTKGARDRKDGEVAGTVTVTDVTGQRLTLPLRFGVETAETPEKGSGAAPAAHHQPRLVNAWIPTEQPTDYYAKIKLPRPMQVKEISFHNSLPDAQLRIRAVSLIDDHSGTSAPLVLSDQLDRQFFFDMKLYTNRNPLPRVFMVHDSLVRKDGTVLSALGDSQIDLRQLAFIAPSPTARSLSSPATETASAGEVQLRSYRPEEIVADVNSKQPGYLMLLDPYYPGWKVQVDGADAPVERADYLFRAVYVAAGKHTVVFKYEPDSFRIGLEITLASLGLLGAALLLLAIRARRVRRHTMI